jgi:hypothetical protein
MVETKKNASSKTQTAISINRSLQGKYCTTTFPEKDKVLFRVGLEVALT